MANCRLLGGKQNRVPFIRLIIPSILALVGGTIGCHPAATVSETQQPLATNEAVVPTSKAARPPSESIPPLAGASLAAERLPAPAPERARPQPTIADHRSQPAMIPASVDASNKQKGAEMSIYSQSTGKVQHASEASFDEMVLESNVPVLVDFYADWCGPCRALAPTLEQFARENPGARVVKVNVDEAPSLAMRYGISGIPSLLVFESGDVKMQHVGLASKSQLQALLRR